MEYMLNLLTDPEKLKEYIQKSVSLHEAQKKAKRDYYHRNKEAISQKRKGVYQSKKVDAEGGSPE